MQYFLPVPNGFNLLVIFRGHYFEYYDLYVSIKKYQNLNSEISKTRTWLKVCDMSQQHEVASYSPENQVQNFCYLSVKMWKKGHFRLFYLFLSHQDRLMSYDDFLECGGFFWKILQKRFGYILSDVFPWLLEWILLNNLKKMKVLTILKFNNQIYYLRKNRSIRMIENQ